VGISRPYVQGIVDAYLDAWEAQDPELIVTIFTPDATYHERVLSDPMAGLDAIRKYWETKVVGAQANIHCRPLSLYVDGSTAIVEWLAEFDDVIQGVRKRMREIAVLEFEWTMERGYLISSLREYWASETVAVLQAGAAQGGHAV
jgi:uncharacterized protein (TIGR02246 family)